MNHDKHQNVTSTQTASESASNETQINKSSGTSAPTAEVGDAYRIRDRDRYLIIGEHGRGGLGRVSRAHDRDLGRDVAIKELISRSNVGEIRFLREALITARLEHPGIVPIHEAGRWPDGTPFYAMKLVAGRSLRELISERHTVEARLELLHHVVAVADAIAYAHGRNVIHRDLKPANIIVGDFGETVVIDWGLAKDLSTNEQSAAVGGPFRASLVAQDLTSNGSVLGTPAYMAPEQERGESVDQRADVFAIGAMLWELCSLHKVPPSQPRLRHKLLRRDGIDPDLVAILDKALHPDPAQRYEHGGALAADLRALKSGTRIAGRSYSLSEILAHWTRHHKALSGSIAAAICLIVIGAGIYLHNISLEQARTSHALARFESAQHDLQIEHTNLIVKHAQLLLTSDPTAAIDILATYRGPDQSRVSQLRAEAIGLGVAKMRSQPHSDNILWMLGTKDGVFSLSLDGTISVTSENERSAILAHGVSPGRIQRFADKRGVLAYICEPENICFMDIDRKIRLATSLQLQSERLSDLSFSPSQNQLATLSRAGILRLFDITNLRRPVERLRRRIFSAEAIGFVDEQSIAVATHMGFVVVKEQVVGTIAIADASDWRVQPADHRVAVIDRSGEVQIFKIDPLRMIAKRKLCQDIVTGFESIPSRGEAAYSCKDGTVGLWNPTTNDNRVVMHHEAHIDTLGVSSDGSYLLAGGGDGTLAVVDLQSELVALYRGHGFRLTAVAGPTHESPYLLSGDVQGGIRSWPLPPRVGSVVANVHTAFWRAIPSLSSGNIIATALQPYLLVLSSGANTQKIYPHNMKATFLTAAAGQETFAAYGLNDVVEVWSSLTMRIDRLIHTEQGSIVHAEFVGHSTDLITAGRDGRLMRWATDGTGVLLAHFEHPIATFATATATQTMVIGTDDGALWGLTKDGKLHSLGVRGVRTMRMLEFVDHSSICVGYTDGQLDLIDTATLDKTVILHAKAAIRDIVISSDGKQIAIATDGDEIYVSRISASAVATHDWLPLLMRARQLSFARDGLLVAVCTDGRVWFYDTKANRWICIPTGKNSITVAAVTESQDAIAVFDTEGRAIWFDLPNILELFSRRFDVTTTQRKP